MIDRYATPEMQRLWAPQTRFALWLEVELLICEAQARRGQVPADVARRLRQTARVGSPERIAEIERTQTQHDVVAFLRSVAEETGPDARWLHRGVGSSDVVDTALSVLLVRAVDLLIAEAHEVAAALAGLADAHRYTVMAGRTHGMHAEPITFGLKAALWLEEVRRGIDRLRRARDEVAVGKISGEVGTYAHLDPEVEADVCRALGLTPARVSSQILQRDRHAALLSAVAILGGTAEKIATEIRALARTEIAEVAEPFAPGQTGSSAMPHKRNPILCERIAGLARLLRGWALAAMEDQALWGERDITHSSVERVALPGATTVLHYMLRTLAHVLRGLRVYPERMRANLDLTGGRIFSHRVLLALLERGLSREEAYRIVQAAALQDAVPFRDALLAAGVFSPDELDALFDLTPYLRHVDAILERVGVGQPSPVPRPTPGAAGGGRV
ncbi:MAG: adenylosuccinate lyase [Armatimonadota bacterium]|nr:adenylosuccinate lyase [Armatimonadota bacterium]MDR7437628.1 adenylosuccinate lyase [Armatimonadota bacterium]MDR7472608.1 adenylosuccinate lyase [Armatimonadota bacterium]MDR7507491.1 adenylosuccinate lyase [Armatimonadota bacterium]MDR7510106.1 adenylosuccinate lyase [Armatimonadota bacterium]